MTTRYSLLIPLLTLASACAYEEEGELEFRMSGTGGGVSTTIVFNTNLLDGDAMSELHQPLGSDHQGHALEAIELDGSEQVDYFEVVDGDIVAYDTLAVQHSGAAVVPSTWTFEGESPLLLAERVLIDGWPHYRFQMGEDYGSTCHDEEDEIIYARLLNGFTLDEGTGEVEAMEDNTYVACTNGATGKAAAWGYYDLAVGLEDFEPFELAIRVIRADYCYDGISFTQPGVALEIEDAWSVDDSDVGTLEAIWGEDGLLCRNVGRLTTIPSTCGSGSIPTCSSGATLSTYPGAKFVTRLPTVM